ncbi:MFS general substrate transporter [Cryphonectria parasitica EP155]|uniref:MFS general substrate transporter n=1 Tax=Cryphonectria parasitica (strain ATCC 38755 / EP155) TaxID=660469 RepID=A0A9P4Y1U1_CRYP1|nr:MFS general substrate transporter [Cryphonectria parasitica EP155]KAF3764890.1 MFS general substrate transporter [Cryphonectria parasitica EP155]
MATTSAPIVPSASPYAAEDSKNIERKITYHRAVDMDNRSNKDEAALESDLSDQEQPKEFKEGGYGWVVVLTVFLINMHTWGLNSAYAVFLAYYLSSDVFPGSTAIDFAFVGGLSISIALLFAPLATIVIGKFGTRVCLQIGVVLETAAFVGASFTSQIWHLILSQGICFGAGMGFLFTGSVGLIPQWFTRKRSLANAMGSAGSGFGGLTYSLAANALITNLGLAWAFRVLAIVAFAINAICSFLARDRNKEVGAVHQAFHKELFKKVELYLFLAWGFFSVLGYIIVVFSLADYASAVGYTATQGSILAAMFNLSQGLGRPVIGYYSDKIGRINVAALSTLIASLAAFFLWIFAGEHYAGAIVYSLFGAFAGCIWPCVAPVAAEIIGLQLLPSAMSITWLVLVLPATFAEVIGLSLVRSGKNGYLHVQVYTGFMFLAAFIFLWLLRILKMHTWDVEAREAEVRRQDSCNTESAAAAAAATGGQKISVVDSRLSLAYAFRACFTVTNV